jgi:hypothetical protein
MPTLKSIGTSEAFFTSEHLSNQKMCTITTSINDLIDNQVVLSSYVELLLQGSAGGAEQTNTPLVMPSAPTGWTRDITIATDNLLRITDGATVPPGADPVALGGQSGGVWAVTGVSTSLSDAHVHTMQNHTHTLSSHTHDISTHDHVIGSHSHTTDHRHGTGYTSHMISGSTSNVTIHAQQVYGQGVSSNYHYHGWYGSLLYHTPSGYTDSASPGATGTPSATRTSASALLTTDSLSVNITGDPSSNNTSSEAGHTHIVTHNGLWRPGYLNIIMCKKD